MQIQNEFIESSLRTAREISDTYKLFCHDSSRTIKSVDDLQKICIDEIGKNIVVFEHDLHYKSQPIQSYVLSYEKDLYEIVYLSGQNFCWKRMVLCKELFHVLLDDIDSRNSNIQNLIDEATMQSIPMPSSQKTLPSKALQMEWLAELAAMEFLFPYSERVVALERIKKNPEIEFIDIAEQYKIPLFYVELYLWQKRMDFLNQFDKC